MIKTSQKILTHLEKHGPASVADLAHALDRSKADVRQQVTLLLNADSIRKLPPAAAVGAGRPAARYAAVVNPPRRLTQTLLNNLVTQLKSFISIQTLVDDLLAEYEPQGSPAIRLNQAVAYLGVLGMDARWQTGPNGPEIYLVREPLTGWISDQEFIESFLKQILVTLKQKAAG